MITEQWAKSTFSGPDSDNCLEARWKKSSRSGAAGHCVEAQFAADMIQVRDTKLGEASPVLSYTRAEWSAFLEGAAQGEFDLPL